MNNFYGKNIGRCLTEYKIDVYDKIISNYDRFVVVSQFDPTPAHMDDLDFKEGYGFPKQHNEPALGYGQVLFGVEEDGKLTKLKSIIDSSD